MDGSTWIGIKHSPLDAGIGLDDVILVWHIHQGVMAVACERYRTNPFYTHWRAVDNSAWIRRAERKPGKADADPLNCVIARDRWGVITVTGWHRVDGDSNFVLWQSPPGPPPRIANNQIWEEPTT